MLAEIVMGLCGFDTVWFSGAGGGPGRNTSPAPTDGSARGDTPWALPAKFFQCRDGQFIVGRTTGPDGDLVCVRWHFDTSDECNLWLAPAGRTILHAALKSAWLRLTGPLPIRRCPRCRKWCDIEEGDRLRGHTVPNSDGPTDTEVCR